ncbi:MAG: hypothetical protein PHZ04_02940 [Patescibacteria group bacterium]|nr:hypothetical protein [Patescibacteria group bacterium]MDD5295232.1 hypothetical protein [Patescibacteria group bacterium]MDD5554660.1 hypothetical protein [Patescibacteria group bacterium]
MFPHKFSLILIFSIILTLGLSVSLGSLMAAWTAPASTPPEGNITAPINTSDTGQAKQGGLILNTGGSANGLIIQFGNVGIGTTSPQAKLEVAGNIIADAPTENNHLATKGYVDASSGSGGLKVYKSDGTTLLGTFGGFYGTNPPSACSGWGFWTPAGALHVMGGTDCNNPPSNVTLYFTGTGCTGGYQANSGNGIMKNCNQYFNITGGDGYCNNFQSYRDPDCTCHNISQQCISMYDYVAETSDPVPGYLCGGGNCVVK